MSLENYPSSSTRKFGERVASALMDASIRKGMGGLGGCKSYRAEDFDASILPYVEAYLEGQHDSVAIIYAAMRTFELQAPNSQPDTVSIASRDATGESK